MIRKALLLLIACAFACSHDMRVTMQEHQLAPQANVARARITMKDLQAIAKGTDQKAVIDAFGLPVMIHVEGRQPCQPWDSCTYTRSYFVYRTREEATCWVHFAEAKAIRGANCDPTRVPVVLGPGDVDPSTGMTAKH